MDISALTSKQRIEAWFEFKPDVKVLIRYLSREELNAIGKKATVITFDSRHQERREFDPIKSDLLVAQAAVLDWQGLLDGAAAYPCTPENIEFLVRNYNGFGLFVNNACADLDRIIAQQKAATEKNSETTSAPA